MYRIPAIYKEELVKYRELVQQASKGEVDPVQFKIFRVVRGIYEQRKQGTFMIRIRCAGGIISPNQLLAVNRIAEKYNSGFLHITTRQEIQLHNINLVDTPNILEELYAVGLSTKGSGGNTVRNITSSVESGISSDEAFDVTPYNIALTNYILALNTSFELPRKLKISFSCSNSDTALAMYNDLGFIAKVQDGVKGFKVYLGGSPSVKPMVGEVLFNFVPADKIFGIARAIIEMFNVHGNRKNRHKARLRYLFYKLGKDKVFALFEEFYNQHKNIVFEVEEDGVVEPTTTVSDDDSFRTLSSGDLASQYISSQKQNGLSTVEIPVMHGNITTEQITAIAAFASNFGEDTIRFSRRQNIHLRNIPNSAIGQLIDLLNGIGISLQKPYILGNLVSCTGADTCQLGICFSKGSLQAIHNRLAENEWIKKADNISINISGCPNACGQHLVADLGFAGRVSRNDRIYPSYNVFAGAIIGEDRASLPKQLGEVAAKDLPQFTEDLLEMYSKQSEGKKFSEFLDSNKEGIEKVFTKYKEIPSYEEDPKYYIDWGNNDLFTLDARGGGECSAGLLDMIESEIKIIQKCKESFAGQQEVEEQVVLLHELVHAASKLLVLTLQEKHDDEPELFDHVEEHFISNQRLSESYTILFSLISEGNFSKLLQHKELVIAYADDAVNYYQELDESLQPAFMVKEVTVNVLHELIKNNEDFELIDVREDWEKNIADIGGRLMPLGVLPDFLDQIPTDKKTIIYCRTGRRSSEAIYILSEFMNTNNLYNLTGGIYAWADEIDNSIQKY